jgi:hypothetical protein
MMVALFHAVPLIIELLWTVLTKYVGVAIVSYRYRRSIRTAKHETDINLGVESAMPYISNKNTKTQSGKKPTASEQNDAENG